MSKIKYFIIIVFILMALPLICAQSAMASPVPTWPITLFEDDFSSDTIGTNWTKDEWREVGGVHYTDGLGNSHVSIQNGVAEFNVRGPISGAYLNSISTSPILNWSSIEFSSKFGVSIPGQSAAFDMFVFSANDPTKYFQVYLASWGGPYLGFYDSGVDKGTASISGFPEVGSDLSMRFTKTGFEFWGGPELLKSYASDSMKDASSFYLRIGGWDYSDTGNQQILFDDVKVTAAPEPISSALFLLGGGALAALRLRKRK